MTLTGAKKTFVLDTNVILHDSSCINQFEEHDVVVPISVIEEIDNFKRGNNVINQHAREFARSLDELTANKLFNGGVSLGEGKGVVRVHLNKGLHEAVRAAFNADNADHRILGAALETKEKLDGERTVVLVTKDVNLRMKAKAFGVPAEDYTTDHVGDVTSLYSGMSLREDFDDDLVARFYQPPYAVPYDDIVDKLPEPPEPNKYFIFRNQHRSALACHDAATREFVRVEKLYAYGVQPRNAEQIFALDALLNPAIPLVTLTGKAGTGKTLLAVAAALESRRKYRQIYVARPVVPLSNKDIGYLPGDVESKIAPYMRPIWDNLKVVQDQFSENDRQYVAIQQMMKDDKLTIEPLSYIRGRSFQRVYFIVDEAQNLTPHEIKTVITRAGEGVKIVFTGDVHQIDHPYLDAQSNGLSYLVERFKGQPLYAHVNLEKGERSELSELASNLL